MDNPITTLISCGIRNISASEIPYLEANRDRITIHFGKDRRSWDAKKIVGVHGAGLTNTIWSANCSLIELMPTSRINRCIEWQAKIANGKYERIYFDPKFTKLNDITNELDALIR